MCAMTKLGTWRLEGHLAVFTAPFSEPQRYTQDALEFAIQNVKAGKSSYATEEAYATTLSHFEQGRGLFPTRIAPTSPRELGELEREGDT